ncbi:hypothetical protein VNO78_00325 [Psophocarpus tetragonolobus]|uniref:Uncharacterized protein n=1 Tax=Psophocarpus tetragonolobus TaxID=3891 RepID=A0AAN9XUJ4_PSOTE
MGLGKRIGKGNEFHEVALSCSPSSPAVVSALTALIAFPRPKPVPSTCRARVMNLHTFATKDWIELIVSDSLKDFDSEFALAFSFATDSAENSSLLSLSFGASYLLINSSLFEEK